MIIDGNKTRSISTNVSLIIISSIITLLITEGILRFILPQNLNGSWFVSTEKGLLVNKSSGTAQHQHGKRIVRYTFYEPNLRDTPIRKTGIRILVVGDSSTFGWLLDKESAYIYHLQEYTDDEFGIGTFQYLNASVGGWGTSDYVAYVEDFGNIVKPDIVLVFFNGNDIRRSVNRGIYTLSGKNKLELNRHILKPAKIKNIVNSTPGYQWSIENSHLIQFAKKSVLAMQYNSKIKKQRKGNEILMQGPASFELDISREKASSLGIALFKRLKDWCDNNSVFLYVTTTGWFDLSDAETSKEPAKAFLYVAHDFFKEINIPFFDISPAVYGKVKEMPGEFIIHGDGHPNENGSKLIADMSWQLFIRKQLHEYCSMRRCN